MSEQEALSCADAAAQVWKILYNRQLPRIHAHAYLPFSGNLARLGFNIAGVPSLRDINWRLQRISGWQVYSVPGLIDNVEFFKRMAEGAFGATGWLRKMEELDYLEEPDMFHDVFGHVPLLCDPVISEYLLALADAALKFIDEPEVIEAIARLYWYTVEFGLVKEGNDIKIYGAGILSSIGETDFCLSDKATRVPFDLIRILQTPYTKDSFQQQYFVLDSIDELKGIGAQLFHAINQNRKSKS
ncbi:MAG: phenylalanine-4-hydroxylase [Bacteroidota bacterium]